MFNGGQTNVLDEESLGQPSIVTNGFKARIEAKFKEIGTS